MMRKLFQSLFGWPCDHDWETLRNGETIEVVLNDFCAGTSKPIGAKKVWLYRCKKCAKSQTVAVKL